MCVLYFRISGVSVCVYIHMFREREIPWGEGVRVGDSEAPLGGENEHSGSSEETFSSAPANLAPGCICECECV